MSDICYFINSCQSPDHVDLGWSIILTELVKTVVEVRSIFVWIEILMTPTVLGSSVVSEPNTVSCMSKSEGKGLCLVDDPALGTAEQTVLQENDRSAFLQLVWVPDVLHSQLVPVWSLNLECT